MEEVLKQKEKAILVAVQLPRSRRWEVENSLDELERLVITAGAEATKRVIQDRDAPHRRTFIGPGKSREIEEFSRSIGADLVAFDHELSPSQQRNLEEVISSKILDRTALILDIFAQRAHSSEGKLQVELAQYVYRLSRLRGRGIELSRLGGGIGTRGPGETKLEVDLRRIRARIRHLTKELSKLRQRRTLQRKKRKKSAVFSVSLVGYTNAGKSTLLNALTDAKVFVEDKLFATLDSTVRRLDFPSTDGLPQKKHAVVLSDTVGFIKDLPHELIAAFRSTLDEVREAQLLLHVVDAAHPQMEEQIKAVEKVLAEIGADNLPKILVFNKIDKIPKNEAAGLKGRLPEAVFISALNKEGLPELLAAIEKKIVPKLVQVRLKIPFDKGKVLERIYQGGRVLSSEHTPEGTLIVAELPAEDISRIKKLIKED